MSDLYTRMRSTASRLLTKYKQGVTYYKATINDESKPWEPTSTATITMPINCVVSGVAQEYVDGSTVIATDKQALISAFPDNYQLSYEYTDESTGDTETRTMTVTPEMVNNWFLFFFLPLNAPKDVAPSNSGVIIVDGKEHQIVRIDAIPGAGTPVAWRVFIRS